MRFKVGDKVKFISQKGGGVVTRIIGSSMVDVEIEDGFAIPTFTSDLLLVDNNENKNSAGTFYGKLQADKSDISKPANNGIVETKSSAIKNRFVAFKEKRGIYLAFVPQNQKVLTGGNIDVYLINYTDSVILYSIFLCDENEYLYSKDYNTIEPDNKFFIESLKLDDINTWASGYLQIMFHNKESKYLCNPYIGDFEIKTRSLYHDANYINSNFFEEKVYMSLLIDFKDVEILNDEEEIEETDEPGVSENITNIAKNLREEDFKVREFIHKYIKDNKIAEVDMHIWELREDYNDLKPNIILELQLEFFRKCLESAIVNKLKKVIFIHGVGNGTLRAEIRNILTEMYPEVTVADASIAKYGIGATEVDFN